MNCVSIPSATKPYLLPLFCHFLVRFLLFLFPLFFLVFLLPLPLLFIPPSPFLPILLPSLSLLLPLFLFFHCHFSFCWPFRQKNMAQIVRQCCHHPMHIRSNWTQIVLDGFGVKSDCLGVRRAGLLFIILCCCCCCCCGPMDFVPKFIENFAKFSSKRFYLSTQSSNESSVCATSSWSKNFCSSCCAFCCKLLFSFWPSWLFWSPHNWLSVNSLISRLKNALISRSSLSSSLSSCSFPTVGVFNSAKGTKLCPNDSVGLDSSRCSFCKILDCKVW